MDKLQAAQAQLVGYYVVQAPINQTARLSELLSVHEITGLRELSLTIEIPAHATVTLVDDLQDYLVAQATLTLIVQDYARLFYELRATEGLAKQESSAVVVDKRINRDITIKLVGQEAFADVRCLCYGQNQDQFTFKTVQEHHARGATSTVIVKSVLNDYARLTCRSLILVETGGKQTTADQVNKNILLSRTARAVSIPMLEVKTNEVKCKHGAAVSRLDDEHRFYLESKGINPALTEQLLLEAFLQ